MPYTDEEKKQAMVLWGQTHDATFVCEKYHLPRSTLYAWLGHAAPKVMLSDSDRAILADRAQKGWAAVDDALLKLELLVRCGTVAVLKGELVKRDLTPDELIKVINTLGEHAARWQQAAQMADNGKEFEVDREIVELQKLVAIKQYRAAS
jgi:hypothetical protein